MKKLVTVTEVEGEGLVALLGQRVLLMCAAYFYYGIITGVNSDTVELTDASIVFDVGKWSDSKWATQEKLPSKCTYVRMAAIESYLAVERD